MPKEEYYQQLNRRHFLSKMGIGIGSLALGSLLSCESTISTNSSLQTNLKGGVLEAAHLVAKAKRIIYLFQSGGPSQLELFDYKPLLKEQHGNDLPASIRMGQRLTGMTAYQKTKPIAAPIYDFKQRGQSGAWVSELMPHTAAIADDLCFIKTMHTEAINHDPAITFFQTGSQQPGRPSMGSWLSYGLGSSNDNLPTFVVLLSRGAQRPQPIYSRLWGNGFLASLHQGVQFRSGKDPVLFLQNPEGITKASRRMVLDQLAKMNELRKQSFGDPDIHSRIAQYLSLIHI